MSFTTAAYFLFKDKDLIIQDKLFLSFVLLVPQKDITDETICCGYESNGNVTRWNSKMAVFTEVYEEQRQRLTMMDANPESR